MKKVSPPIFAPIGTLTMVSIQAAGRTNIGGYTNAINQDAFFQTDTMFGIFDGHGSYGREAALIARGTFLNAAPSASFESMFAEAETSLQQLLGQKGCGGGTTASILRIDPLTGTCTVGHVGDSDVRYFDIDDSDNGQPLTVDHTATSLDEFQRIQTTPNPAHFHYDGSHTRSRSQSQPQSHPVFQKAADGSWARDYTKTSYLCTVRNDPATYLINPKTGEHLAVTRALGDFDMKPYGVSAEPSILTATPSAQSIRVIVMATDGLWDVMQYADVRSIVRRRDLIGNAEEAADALMSRALERGETIFGTDADNTTLIVIYVTPVI